MLEVVVLCIFLISRSAGLKNGTKTRVIRRSIKLIFPLMILPKISNVNAIPPLELQAKLREKIRKGKLLIEELNELLDQVKKNIKEKVGVDKEMLNKLVDIKDKFKALEVDPGDLPLDLIEKFKEKVLEAFGLILASYKLDKFPQAKDPESVEEFQEKVVHKVKKEFYKHYENEL